MLTQILYAAAGSAVIIGISFVIGRTGLSALPSLILGIVLSVCGYGILLAAGRNRYFMSAVSAVLRRKKKA